METSLNAAMTTSIASLASASAASVHFLSPCFGLANFSEYFQQASSYIQPLMTKQTVAFALVAYLGTVRLFRYRRESTLRARFGYHDRQSLARMTNTEAQLIIKAMASYEFPVMHALSMEFALFKVCSHGRTLSWPECGPPAPRMQVVCYG